MAVGNADELETRNANTVCSVNSIARVQKDLIAMVAEKSVFSLSLSLSLSLCVCVCVCVKGCNL